MRFINIGHENSVNINRIVSINNAGPRATNRLIQNAKKTELLIDSTEGNKANSVIVIDSGHVILSAYKAETLRKRIHNVE